MRERSLTLFINEKNRTIERIKRKRIQKTSIILFEWDGGVQKLYDIEKMLDRTRG